MLQEKSHRLFDATYRSLINRTQKNGYAQTSINGVYPGMFGRDSAIQIMAHVAAGDYDHAAGIMQFILDYHKKYGYGYVLHVMDNEAPVISDKLQVDSTFFFLHAWYLYATQAPESETKARFLAGSESAVKGFADYFLHQPYLTDKRLFWNPSLEHSREGRYHQCYDLLTNVYGSQALYEMALYFQEKDAQKAAVWKDVANAVAAGVHQHLTAEIDGKRFYAELIDTEYDHRFLPGFSWVNLAPMGCDWFGAQGDLLENTYQLYLKYGSCEYYGRYYMMDVASTYNGVPITAGIHVIGKGLAWEMIYCKKMGYHDRLDELEQFVASHSDQMYRETWGYTGGGSDTANQEHASWMVYAHCICFPELL